MSDLSTIPERYNAWHLAHVEVGYLPTQDEIDAWWEANTPAVAGGCGRSCEDTRQSGAAVAWAMVSLFWLAVGLLAGAVIL